MGDRKRKSKNFGDAAGKTGFEISNELFPRPDGKTARILEELDRLWRLENAANEVVMLSAYVRTEKGLDGLEAYNGDGNEDLSKAIDRLRLHLKYLEKR